MSFDDGGAGSADARVNDADPNAPDANVSDARISGNTHSMDFLPGADHYLNVPDQAGTLGLDPVDTMTVEAWINIHLLPATQQRYAVVVKADINTDEKSYGFEFKNNGGTPLMEARVEGTDSTGNALDSVGWVWADFEVGTWYHVAFTYDIAPAAVIDRFKFYVNGVENTNASLLQGGGITSIRDSIAPVTIGSRISTKGNMQNQFDGKIDEVRIWARARTQPAIAGSFEMQLEGGEEDLLGYWPLNNSLTDATTRGNNATIVGDPAPEFVTDTPF